MKRVSHIAATTTEIIMKTIIGDVPKIYYTDSHALPTPQHPKKYTNKKSNKTPKFIRSRRIGPRARGATTKVHFSSFLYE